MLSGCYCISEMGLRKPRHWKCSAHHDKGRKLGHLDKVECRLIWSRKAEGQNALRASAGKGWINVLTVSGSDSATKVAAVL